MEDEFRSKRLELAGEAAARVLARAYAAKVIERARRAAGIGTDGAPLADRVQGAQGGTICGGRGGEHG